MFTEYKANGDETPGGRYCSTLHSRNTPGNVYTVVKEGFEADDIMAP